MSHPVIQRGQEHATACIGGLARVPFVLRSLVSMHSRTPSRHLEVFGTRYRELLDEGRFGITRQMRENTALEMGPVAAALDYADASAFTRAFRRWSGTRPGQWRAARVNRPAR